MKIHFLGAAGTVTGSCYLVDTGQAQVLVDCGLFQGSHHLEKLNTPDEQVDVTGIDAVWPSNRQAVQGRLLAHFHHEALD